MREDTIAAIGTAPGESGIGIIRISGEEALPILTRIFVPVSHEIKGRVLSYGHIIDPGTGKILDEVMAVYMKGPYTYTAEDVAEIQCHGSFVSLRNILELVLRSGARLAEKGEFTKRAFLNGRLDLSQAEAVIDLIRARSEKTFDVAMSQLEGVFSAQIGQIREDLVDVLVNLTVNIDYPDEDIEQITYDNLKKSILKIKEKIDKLLSTSDTGRIIREGLKISIIGKPNVGKSSLMNALMGENRAIVTDIPGTTRDTIEETLVIRDIPVVLTDTAGIRDTDDTIERIGIEKSKEAFNRSDLVIFVIDASRPLERDDMDIIRTIGDRKVIVLLNKTDKGIYISEDDIKKDMPNACVIKTSLINGEGTETLAEVVENLVYGGHMTRSETNIVTNARHKALLQEASGSMKDAVSMIIDRQPLELIEIDVNHGYEALGEITGQTAVPDIIDRVFERFCLGK